MSGPRFEHVRHRPPRELTRPRELVLALPQMHSNVNFSRVVRAAGCFGVRHVIAAGRTRIDPKIARDSTEFVQIETHRSLVPVLKRKRDEGYQLIALEQATNSETLFEFAFDRRTVLIGGHERLGVEADVLACVDRVLEIPMYGLPLSLNAATAVTIAIYEYCRQFPDG